MDHYTKEKIIEGIRKEDDKIIFYIYEKCFKQIKHLIKINNGDDNDTKDIFQEAMMIIFAKIKNNELNFECSFSTYIYSVCRLLWLKELEKRRRRCEKFFEGDNYIDVDNDVIELFEKNERRKLYLKHFNELSEACQKLLTLFLNGVPIKEITKIMGYSSDQHTKNRRYRCKKTLIDKIRSNPEYTELKNEKYRDDNEVPRW